jgi:hypothetical protein
MSQTFFLAATSRTPEVTFDVNAKSGTIEGECYPEDADKFFASLNKALEDYFASGCNELQLKVNLIYFNSSSARALMELMDSLEALASTKKIEVNWLYEEGDDITEEFIEDVTSGYQGLKVTSSSSSN